MGRPFQALTIDEIMNINRRMIMKYGGLYSDADDNFQNRASLEYILDACLSTLFGKDIYQSVFEKIAAIVQTIISKHVFHDGNKRTGLAVAMCLLAINGYSFLPTIKDNDFFVRIADENLSVEKIADWLQKRAA